MNLKRMMGQQRVADAGEFDADTSQKIVKLSKIKWSYDEFERLTGLWAAVNSERYAYDDLNAQTRYVALYYKDGLRYSEGNHGFLVPSVYKGESFDLFPSSSENSSISFMNATESNLRKAEKLFADALRQVGINADANLVANQYQHRGRTLWSLRLRVTPHKISDARRDKLSTSWLKNDYLEAIKKTRWTNITESMLKLSGVYDLVVDYFPKAALVDLRGGGVAFDLTRYDNDWFFIDNKEFVNKMKAMLGDAWGISNTDGKFLIVFGTN